MLHIIFFFNFYHITSELSRTQILILTVFFIICKGWQLIRKPLYLLNLFPKEKLTFLYKSFPHFIFYFSHSPHLVFYLSLSLFKPSSTYL